MQNTVPVQTDETGKETAAEESPDEKETQGKADTETDSVQETTTVPAKKQAKAAAETETAARVCHITIDFNGGTDSYGNPSQTEDAICGDKYNYYYYHQNPTREGYQLAGWSEQKDAETATYVSLDDYDVPETEEVTLYAVWEEYWTVTLDANGGYFYDKDVKTESFTVKKGSSLYDNYTPSNEGKALDGWSISKNATTAEYSLLSDCTPEEDEEGHAL